MMHKNKEWNITGMPLHKKMHLDNGCIKFTAKEGTCPLLAAKLIM
jgi:hypothetical protein